MRFTPATADIMRYAAMRDRELWAKIRWGDYTERATARYALKVKGYRNPRIANQVSWLIRITTARRLP